jgi:hypothetical protein
VPEGAIARALASGDARVRSAALRAAAVDRERFGGEAIAQALRDPDPGVRDRAVEALAAAGAAGVEAALGFLGDANEAVAGAALGAVVTGSHPRRRQLLSAELRRRVALAWHALAGIELVPDESEPRARFLRLAASDTFTRHRRFAFRMLEMIESPRVVRRVERALRFGNPRARANALEVLSNLGDRAAGRLLVLMHEPGPLEERLAALGPDVHVAREPRRVPRRRAPLERPLALARAGGVRRARGRHSARGNRRHGAIARPPTRAAVREPLARPARRGAASRARRHLPRRRDDRARRGPRRRAVPAATRAAAEAWLDYAASIRGSSRRCPPAVISGRWRSSTTSRAAPPWWRASRCACSCSMATA